MDKAENKQQIILFPLRIDARTVIYVPEEKCNETYAQEKRIKFSKGFGKTSIKDIGF